MTALFLRRTSAHQPPAAQIEAFLQLTQDESGAAVMRAIRDLISGPFTPGVLDRLAALNVYIEQDPAHQNGGRGHMFQRLLRDAATGRFQRLIVPTITTFGQNICEVVSVVCALLDLGLTIIPAQSDADCIDAGMTKVLRLVESWHRELDREQRSAAIKAGQSKVRRQGTRVGRPKRIFDREAVLRLRDEERRSWTEIAQALGIGVGTARRAYQQAATSPGPARNMGEVA